MNPSPATSSGESPAGDHAAGPIISLRRWPAVVCLLAIFAFPFLSRVVDGPSLPLMMISFMAPALFGMLIFVWWIAGSRASAKEKGIGILGVVLLSLKVVLAAIR